MANKILQIDLQHDITPQIGTYDNTGSVTPNNWLNEDGVYSLGPTNVDGTTPYYWFTPTKEVTDFDLCWEDYQDRPQTNSQYHLEIGDSAGNVVLSAFRVNVNYNIGPVNVGAPAYQTWHKILVEVRKASASSSTVTAYVDGKKVATGTSSTLITSAKIALLGHVPNVYHWQNAGQRLRYVTIYDRSYSSKGVNLDGIMTTITGFVSKLKGALSTVAFSGSYNDLSNKPTIPAVNDATLTIQRNGTTLDTFTANASVDKTINISTTDDTKIPLSGSNQISGSLIPATDNSIDIGSSTKNIKMLYTKGITIDGAQFLPSDYVPRSGGSVITGNYIARTVDNDSLALLGSTGWKSGAVILATGKDYPSPNAKSVIRMSCILNDTTEKNMWLRPDGTWTWDGTACQITSDQRYKQQITEIDNALLDAWEDVNLVQFKYNDAVDQKKDKARLHTGYVVQQIDEACKKHNIDVSKYGLYCHEEYKEEIREVEHEDGTKTIEVVRPASEHYSLRYTEALIVECAFLRKCIKELRNEIEELKSSK